MTYSVFINKYYQINKYNIYTRLIIHIIIMSENSSKHIIYIYYYYYYYYCLLDKKNSLSMHNIKLLLYQKLIIRRKGKGVENILICKLIVKMLVL